MAKRVERNIIAIVGRTNVGKSSLLNLLSGQKDYAIVDSTPGTTADTVAALMEIHDLGPFKVLDTAGVDERSALGDKKRDKTHQAIAEADLSLIVLDLPRARDWKDFSVEKELAARIQRHGKQGLFVYNLHDSLAEAEFERHQRALDEVLGFGWPSLAVRASDAGHQLKFADFLRTHFRRETREVDLLPVKGLGYTLLVIPMDEETPAMRLLRPQDMAVERILRSYGTPVLYRPDLKRARSANPEEADAERARFVETIETLSNSSVDLKLVITDSQAFDVIAKWTPTDIPLTSFSVMMTNYMSFGNLGFFVEGVKAVDRLEVGDSVLIVEACNHDRQCDDIATVQIPRRLETHVGGKLKFEFSFGHTFPEDLSPYKMIVHCGACMIDRQKYLARVAAVKEANVPMTNYGLLLSYLQGKEILERAVKPFTQ